MKHSPNSKPVRLHSLAICCLIPLLCSCASTSVKQTWKSPEYQGGPLTKLAVLAIDDGAGLRRGFENRLVNQISKGGASVSTTFNLISLPEINQDKMAAAARIRATGAEALVTMRLADATSSYREMRPGSERYAQTLTGLESGTWYDYYSLAFADMGTTYSSLKQQVYLETIVFDLKTAKRLWSGGTKTVVTESMDRAAEVDRIIAKVVAAMRKDGIIP